ncbi:hypothetical protein [Clostridium estertheticum]|nr:hypothetical protein [Clostridium estertheticum]
MNDKEIIYEVQEEKFEIAKCEREEKYEIDKAEKVKSDNKEIKE